MDKLSLKHVCYHESGGNPYVRMQNLFYSEPSPLIGTTLVKELSLSLLQSFKI